MNVLVFCSCSRFFSDFSLCVLDLGLVGLLLDKGLLLLLDGFERDAVSPDPLSFFAFDRLLLPTKLCLLFFTLSSSLL